MEDPFPNYYIPMQGTLTPVSLADYIDWLDADHLDDYCFTTVIPKHGFDIKVQTGFDGLVKDGAQQNPLKLFYTFYQICYVSSAVNGYSERRVYETYEAALEYHRDLAERLRTARIMYYQDAKACL